MDSYGQSETMKYKRRSQGELSPEERAQEARRRILEAVTKAGTPAGKLRDQARRDPLLSTGLALLAGFIIGYSPEFRSVFMTSIGDLVQVFLRKW